MFINLQEHIHLAGRDATLGLPQNMDVAMPQDANLAALLKSLGAVPICRTNLPQTCLSFDCSNPIFGKTSNPRDVSRIPGGSSGGEGALIAAGGSIIGFGNERRNAHNIKLMTYYCCYY